jgi:hypothetical protein
MTAGDVPAASGRGPLAAVSWLDWKLGARMLLKYPALTFIGGLSLAVAIAIGVVGIEVAGELLYAWSRGCSTISRSGGGL